jgi:hypothetical protein
VPVDLVAIDRDIPFHARIGAFGQLSRILPQQIARGGIQSLDLVTESVHQHHTIVDQGGVASLAPGGNVHVHATRRWFTFAL